MRQSTLRGMERSKSEFIAFKIRDNQKTHFQSRRERSKVGDLESKAEAKESKTVRMKRRTSRTAVIRAGVLALHLPAWLDGWLRGRG